jgi:hypothetical protein
MRPCWTKLAFQIGNGVHYAKAYSKVFLVGTFIYLQALSGHPWLKDGGTPDVPWDGAVANAVCDNSSGIIATMR